jgi:tRNA A37 threonylcarbamoyladenosine synthetase subunit TsaC/SUA5/YrdC
MVEINGTSRLPTIKTQIILTQTDTTVGFSSQNEERLKEVKTRQSTKPFIKLYQDFKTLKKEKMRVPNSQKNRVRRSKKTTFIVKNLSFRVAQGKLESNILRGLKWNYSTSANESGKNFERNFCEEKADIIVEDKNSLYEGKASTLLKINAKKIKRLR